MCITVKSLLVKQQYHSNVIRHCHVQGDLALFDNLQGILCITFNIFTCNLKLLNGLKNFSDHHELVIVLCHTISEFILILMMYV